MSGWQPIETAPKDKPIIGGYFNQPWSESHREGDITRCWWQPEFKAFISGCREMILAAGYSFDGGSSRKLHSPTIEQVTHWMPLPEPPTEDGISTPRGDSMIDQQDCALLARWAKDRPEDPMNGLMNALTPEARGLRPIDTAPRDGTKIWLFSESGYHAVEGFWNLRMQWFPLMNPEYWLPL